MHVRSLLAGAGLAVVVAAVPVIAVSAASADDGAGPSSSTSSTTGGCTPALRWEIAGDAAAAVAEHPTVAGLLRALGDAPAGTRQEVAREYLADHPGSAEELRDVRATVRQQVRTCRSGG